MRGELQDARAHRLQRRQRLALERRWERRRRHAEDRPRRQQPRHPRSRLAAHQRGPFTLTLGNRGGARQVARHAVLQPRVVALEPRLEGLPRLPRLQRPLRQRPRRETGRREQVVADVLHQGGERAHHRLQGRRGPGVGEAERVDGDDEARGERRRYRLAQHHFRDTREGRRVAREPAGGVGARRLRQHSREIEPPVGGADAVEPAEARRHAHRAAGVGAERGVAEALRDGRGRAGGRAAGYAVGRRRVERRAIERVLAEDAERHLVGDRLADQRGAGVQQPLHGPGVACGHRILPGPVRIAAARRVARDVEKVLDGERQAGQRTVRRPGNAHARTGDEGAGHGGILRDRARLPGPAIASLDTGEKCAFRAARQNAPIRANYDKASCNSARSLLVEGKGFVDCALNSDATLARTT